MQQLFSKYKFHIYFTVSLASKRKLKLLQLVIMYEKICYIWLVTFKSVELTSKSRQLTATNDAQLKQKLITTLNFCQTKLISQAQRAYTACNISLNIFIACEIKI